MRKIFLIVLVAGLFSCGQNSTKQKELELKEKELALKERELALKENQSKPSNPDSPNKAVANEPVDLKVKAYLIYRSGKLSNFDILNDKNKQGGLFNTVIGEGIAEDWSDKTKIIITGTGKNVDLLVKNGDKIALDKKNLEINGTSEFTILETGCQELSIKVSAGGKNIFTGKIPYICGE